MSILPSSRSVFPLLACLLLAAGGCDGGGPPGPVAGHPRLFVTEKDVDRLRSWATADNLAYAVGVEANGKEFKEWMDAGELVLDEDCENEDGFISCEWIMETFAFL